MTARPGVRIAALSVALVALAAFAGAALAQADDTNPIPPFSRAVPGGAFPAAWVPLTFPHLRRHTTYTLAHDADAGVVVRAEADASASGLVVRLDHEPADWPRLAWRWKVDQTIVRSDVTRRAGDDYPVRLYVAFKHVPERVSPFERARHAIITLLYGEPPPHAALNYIWDARSPVGTVVPNPYTSRVRMIVVESGTERLGRWLGYERDVLADYRAAFGEEPPPISGVGIMSDADDTGESALAWYGDVTLSRRR